MQYLFPYPKEASKINYLKEEIDRKAYYGLPKEVIFCPKCVISNQKPTSTVEFLNDGKKKKQAVSFNELGICDACLVKETKKEIDWKKREEELKELCNRYRRNDGQYDCLVPGSGGKDSFMTAHLLKYKYGMNPLTCTWAPHIYTDWGWKNQSSWIHAGFTNILITPNGKVHRLITRIATDKLFYPFQGFILGQKNLAPKIAAQYDIELIFYGENQAEYGNPKDDMKTSKMSSNFFAKTSDENIYIAGATISELKEIGLTNVDLNPYLPMDKNILEEKNIQYHYLGYYEKWHPQGAYYYSVENGNFESAPERTAGTYTTYTSIDDKLDDFHFHTTFIKFGIGRATYEAAKEIRSGDLTREEGIALIKKYDGEFPKRWSDEIFNYLSLSEKEYPNISSFFENPEFDLEYYNRLSEKFRSPHLWNWDDKIGWDLRYKIHEQENFLSQEESAKTWQGNE